MRVKPDQQKPGLNPTLTHAHTFQLRMLLELEGPFKTVKDRILEASQNMINCLVSNIYNFSPTCFARKKVRGNFNLF